LKNIHASTVGRAGQSLAEMAGSRAGLSPRLRREKTTVTISYFLASNLPFAELGDLHIAIMSQAHEATHAAAAAFILPCKVHQVS
jgi:hypothetical protein